jgi:hypothetical protein
MPERPPADQDHPLRPRGRDDGKGKSASKIYIPYFPGDDGDRSSGFPPSVTWYWCPGIRVLLPDGTLYTGGRLPRDEASSVAVQVANSGSEPAWAKVKLYWTDPTAGFGPPNLHLSPLLTAPFASLRVPVGTVVTTPPVPFTPASDTPDHVCLVAVVSAFGDEPSGSWASGSDCHYAQHNVMIEHLAPEGVTPFRFYVKNPFSEFSARLSVRVAPAPREQTEALARVYRAEPADLDPRDLGLAVGRRPMDPASELELELEPGEREPCQALVAPTALRPGQFGILEVRMTASSPESEQHDRDGGLGLVVFPPERR